MDWVIYILLGVLIVVFGYFAMKQRKRDANKSLNQKREEMWQYSQRRVNEEFKQAKDDEGTSSEDPQS